MGKTCFFIGHREAGEELYPLLCGAVERHIVEYGVTEFVVGRYGGFDRLAARAVQAAKKCHKNIRLILLLPYHPAQRPVSLPEGFDDTWYPLGMEQVPYKAAIVRANRYLVDHADFLIAGVWHSASNAGALLAYGRRRAAKGFLRITVLPRDGESLCRAEFL